MGYSIMRQNDKAQYNTVDLIADSAEDINTLPLDVNPGSTCLITSTKEVYIFNASKQWVKLA